MAFLTKSSDSSSKCSQRHDAGVKLASLPLQAKLRMGQPGDSYEQEADRVADRVTRMPDPVLQQQHEEVAARQIMESLSNREDEEYGMKARMFIEGS